jgi:hypothetical protein
MGWTTPYRHRRATVRVVRTCRKGAARDEYYHDPPGYRQVCVPGTLVHECKHTDRDSIGKWHIEQTNAGLSNFVRER